MDELTVLFLSDEFPPETNAAATRVYERALYWNASNVNTEFLTSFPNKFYGKRHDGYSSQLFRVDYTDGISVVRVKTFVTDSSSAFMRVLHQISYMTSSFIAGLFMKRPNLIVATTPSLFCGISGLLLSKIKRVPFVLEIADIWTDSIKGTNVSYDVFGRLFLCIENIVYRRSNIIVVLTKSFKINLVERGIEGNRIFVIQNGVIVSNFQNIEKCDELIERYDMQDKIVVGYVGSLGSAQGLSNVVEAAKIAHSEGIRDLVFMFVGEGFEKKKLMLMSEKLDNVRFIPGQPKDKIQRYLSISDIGLVHLKDDIVFSKVIPSKMFEVMAAGLPILLVSPSGEASQIVQETESGRWINSGEPKILLETIVEMSKDKKGMRRFKRNSLRSANFYSRERQAKEFLNVLRNAVS